MRDVFVRAKKIYEDKNVVIYFDIEGSQIFKKKKEGKLSSWLMDADFNTIPEEAQNKILSEIL